MSVHTLNFYILFLVIAVTSVQFNPVDDKYFISGSIDGKVRIWAVESSLVVDWTDIRDIVTAVCYRPNGEVITHHHFSHYLGKIDRFTFELMGFKYTSNDSQGVLVGSIAGSCRFYSISGTKFKPQFQNFKI